ncbi:MAG: hypothetical protein SGILL_003028 [Bacillariaceae sp.]
MSNSSQSINSRHNGSVVGDSSTGSMSSTKSSVSFSSAHVREYERVLEGRPDVPMALTLGWDYREQEPMSVDDFQKYKHSSGDAASYTSSGSYAPQTSIHQRFTILHYIHGFSMEELQNAEALRIQNLEQDAANKKKKNGGMFHKLKGFGRRKDSETR